MLEAHGGSTGPIITEESSTEEQKPDSPKLAEDDVE